MIDPETRRKLRLIGISEAVEVLEMMEHDQSYQNLPFDDKMRVVIDYVYQKKENESVKRLLQRAHLRIATADISGIIYDGRPLSRELVANLGTCQFAETHRDVAIVGYTGTGKTYLACALAKQACKRRLRTLYVRAPDLFMDREERLSAGTSEQKLLKKYARYDVLVVDEWLIDALEPDQMRFMFELVDRRSDTSSTIWCSQYPVADWHQRLGGGTHADAILDRIVHNATVVETGEVNMRELTACGTRD